MNSERLKIWHVGNWCIHIGQKYIESPFEAPSKDVEGELGKGGWGRSRFRQVLPVECLQHDDLIESTAGFPVRCKDPGHPAGEIDWQTIPPLLGFNETSVRHGARVLVEIGCLGQWYPLLAEHEFGEGRASCWTTGVSPHWGINFMKWEQYGRLWERLFSRGT